MGKPRIMQDLRAEVKPASQSERWRRVEGRHNTLLRELRAAFRRGELTEDGLCAIEGVKIIEEAVRSGLKFRAMFFSESGANRAGRLLPQIAANVEVLLLPDKLFLEAVPSESPQGVAALVRMATPSLADLIETAGLILVVAGIQDPGNLGTMLRSAEAFGASGVLMGEGTVSCYNSKVVRGSAGSVFRLPVAKCKLAEVVAEMSQRGVRMVATSSHRGTVLKNAKLEAPLAIFVGNEGAGLPAAVMAAMDERVAIPHSERVESLNAGVAASIILYEAARRRT